MENKTIGKNGKTYRKYGFIGYFGSNMLYRLRYVNLELGYKVLQCFKDQGLHGKFQEFECKNCKALEIELITQTSIPIIKAKILTIESNIKKLESKKNDLEQLLF